MDTEHLKPAPALSLRGRALRYLARREHTRQDLCNKLRPYAESPEALKALCDALEQSGWLSDARYAQARVHCRAARYGQQRLRQELMQAGVEASEIASALAGLEETEFARAREVWQKKFTQLPQTLAERARQSRFLLSRGFSSSTVRMVLDKATLDMAE